MAFINHVALGASIFATKQESAHSWLHLLSDVN
jgi:hypothetical protein